MSSGASDQAEIRHLLNEDGSCFEGLDETAVQLDALDNDARVAYRNANAATIATTPSDRLLVVAGPGTGKSHLFLARIAYWLPKHPGARIHVATFVRKLVSDLQVDIERTLSADDRARVDVSTLHTLARSLLERAGGTAAWPMRPHIRIIDGFWDPVVWDDVLAFLPESDADVRDLHGQYHTSEMDPSPEWHALVGQYRALCQYFNAVGFSYLIAFASEAVVEQPALAEHRLWIIDEYQDFNPTEDSLIQMLTGLGAGDLLAGDDEQALYQRLKASRPEIIIGHYESPQSAKAMLPFCSRCSYYVCRAASAFIARHRTDTAVDKVYLPLKIDADAPRVRVVAAAAASTAVDYVRQFMDDHRAEYEAYLAKRAAGEDSDPFLLVLSASGGLTLGRGSREDGDLFAMVESFAAAAPKHSGNYLRVVTYYAAGTHTEDNFAVRKVLHFEGLTVDEVHGLVVESIQRSCALVDVVAQHHPGVLERLQEVVHVVDNIDDPMALANALCGVLGLVEAEALGVELAENPIGKDARKQEDDEAIETAGAVPPVAIMTMVGSKGLSAHHVIVVGCDNVNMQYVTPLTFFVAITRARQSLHLVASMKTGGSSAAHPFLYDLPADCCEFVSYKKTDQSTTDLGNSAGLTTCIERWERSQAFGTGMGTVRRPPRTRDGA